jgi:hypothetical protein
MLAGATLDFPILDHGIVGRDRYCVESEFPGSFNESAGGITDSVFGVFSGVNMQIDFEFAHQKPSLFLIGKDGNSLFILHRERSAGRLAVYSGGIPDGEFRTAPPVSESG